MIIKTMKWRDACVVCVLGMTLTACGESDLTELNNQAYEDGVIAAGVPSAALPGMIDLTGYELVFMDEFNDSSLDSSKWRTAPISPDTVIYNQLQHYVDTQDASRTLDSPFSFNGEYLTINATPTPEGREAEANSQPYLSGLISTRERFDATYGYVEARVSVTQGRGIWPAFWMLGAQTDQLRPEVYILEYDGSRADSAFHTYNYVDENGDLRSPGQHEVMVPGMSEGFHTVGLRWNDDELLFLVDGQLTWRIVGDSVPRENMYLIFNLAMGGIWTGAPDGTTPNPASLKIDYVRFYQRTGS